MSVSDFDPAFVAALSECKARNEAIEEEYKRRLVTALLPALTREFEPLFEQRQPFLDAQEGFWSGAVLSRGSPTSAFTSDADAKVLRALTSLRITKRIEGEDDIVRTVTFTMRPSVFVEGGALTRTMNGDGRTLAASGVKWKAPEQARRGSILRVFDAATPDAEAKEILDALDHLFQNPKLVMDPNV